MSVAYSNKLNNNEIEDFQDAMRTIIKMCDHEISQYMQMPQETDEDRNLRISGINYCQSLKEAARTCLGQYLDSKGNLKTCIMRWEKSKSEEVQAIAAAAKKDDYQELAI
jgi:formiminotetrahydrofolate cyclodeaminase